LAREGETPVEPHGYWLSGSFALPVPFSSLCVSVAHGICYEDELEKETEEDYTLIHSEKHFKIYHLKNTDTDEDP
jgi:hypothetical protein